jgi:protein involved in polysaccharide export with SLBB domain
MKRFQILFSLIAVVLFSGCLGRTVSVPTVAGMETSGPVGFYRLRPMDPLVVNLLGIPQEKALETVIDEKGNITLPYIEDPVKASDLTTSELERKIQQIYTESQIYRSITVNVLTSAKSYYVEGEVTRPQEYPLNRRITLLQAIAAASGYNDFANRKNVTITRNGQIIKVNAKDIERHPEKDILIEAGDRIKVHRSLF